MKAPGQILLASLTAKFIRDKKDGDCVAKHFIVAPYHWIFSNSSWHTMIFYENDVERAVSKGIVPKDVFKRISSAFVTIDAANDLKLFDIKKLKSSKQRIYYRLRKGKYRAIFYVENGNYFVISIAKREEVYRQWE